MKWITWEEQGELANLIMNYIDKESYRELIIKQIMEEHSGKYIEDEIDKKITELKKKWLIVENDGQIHVTACSHDAIVEATKSESFTDALRKLKKLKIFHPDMVLYGVINQKETPKVYKG